MQVAARQLGPQFPICECPTLSSFGEERQFLAANKFASNEYPRASTKSPLSNRYNKLLEFSVSYTKKTIAPHSNRYKMALSRNRFRALNCVVPSDTIAFTKYIFVGQQQFAETTSEEVTAQ